jgi:hypothetical protein
MAAMLNYAQPAPRQYSKTLARCASVLLFYPLIPVGLLYGEWLLTWWILGHAPRHALDEAGTIRGSAWVHPLTLFALALSWPAAVAALVLNVVHFAVNRPPSLPVFARVAVLVVLWLGLYALIRFDPGDVHTWWVID